MSIPNNILSVKIGSELFAFDGEQIEQILRVPKITIMPLTSDSIRGVSSISGRTVTIIDMSIILGSKKIDENQNDARVLTVKNDGKEYGILVDAVLEMDSIIQENYEVSKKENSKISAVYKKEDKIYQIIDISKVVNSLSLTTYSPVLLDKFDISAKSENGNKLNDNTQRCIFLTLGKEHFAISLEVAREIIFIPEKITAISEAGFGVMGMITLRDELVTALDLKKIINVEPIEFSKDMSKQNRFLLLSYEGNSVALLVDSISEVKDIPNNKIEVLPQRFADSKVESIFKDEDKIVSIVSTDFLKELSKEYVIEENKDLELKKHSFSTKDNLMSEVAAFKINNEEFALEIQDVQEIIKYTDVTAIPEAPKFIDGLINLRGVVIPIISLPQRLGFEKQITSKSKILICDLNSEKIGLFVDDVNEIMFIEDENVSKSNNEDSLFSEVITLNNGKRIILKLRLSEVLDEDTLDDIKMIKENQ